MINQGQDNAGLSYKVAAFYSFLEINGEILNAFLQKLREHANRKNVKGMVLIACEGINGTICGSSSSISDVINLIKSDLCIEDLEIKYSFCDKQAFRRFRARQKTEIVTMGISYINTNELTGNYIEPSDWNKYLDDPDVLVIDARNEYEVSVGTFEGALNPHTDKFSEFPDWVEKTLRPIVDEKKPREIAMFCTGGIRCEKATCYLRQEGFEGVTQLHGGILKYLEEVPISKSKWNGECFVFDRRVALNHNLVPGMHRLCNACGMPLSPEDLMKESYIRGVKCHYCVDRFSDDDRARFADRQKHLDNLIGNDSVNTLSLTP
ncbi:rhodanese-related sulfurtransferase [Prochlorococcus sp. MIT 1223]|uniref:oxygen-dependent tRNA uridine(34) hydroxylase TrhO n=1 Tax=Prochlorococcus sp. MIT 1223 TaxID=3096217 RepID=UPI002A74ADF8|nr:rhodanese-related sulfurtransferase [Prochlorococcus sp. MIT 1223]